jgi:tetratricopeptide (TPR) repeat protein
MLPEGLFFAFKSLLAVVAFGGAFVLHFRYWGHCPPELRHRRKGLDMLLAGRPAEAEKYFRKCLAEVNPSARVRPLVCLADAIMDQGRYEESRQYLNEALELGDSTGSCHGSVVDLLLLTRNDPSKALEMADQAAELSIRVARDVYYTRNISDDLKYAKCWSRKAEALAQLERWTEARMAVDRATRYVESAQTEILEFKPKYSFSKRLVIGGRRLAHGRDLAIAATHWRLGLAHLAVNDYGKALTHFRVTRDTDRRGKYRRLALRQLEEMESRS